MSSVVMRARDRCPCFFVSLAIGSAWELQNENRLGPWVSIKAIWNKQT
jgi:hypothetical protein